MRVIATAKGFYGNQIVNPGEEFEVGENEKGTWFTPVEKPKGAAKKEDKPEKNEKPAKGGKKDEKPAADDAGKKEGEDELA